MPQAASFGLAFGIVRLGFCSLLLCQQQARHAPFGKAMHQVQANAVKYYVPKAFSEERRPL